MSIAFDASSGNPARATGATSLTFSHTVTGSNTLLIVMTDWNNGATTTDSVTGVTYNGVAMTKLTSIVNTGNTRLYMWYLLNPATGANNVVVSCSSGTIRARAASYTGVKQSGFPDSSNSGVADGASSITQSTTVVASNCWLVGVFANDSTPTVSGGTGTTLHDNVNTNTDNDKIIGDSNGTVGTGSQSLIYNSTAAANNAAIVASFAPFVAGGTANPAFLTRFV